MNIYQKLIEVRKTVPYLQKESEGSQYKYVGSSQVLAAVRKKMDDLGLLLVTRIIDHNVMHETVENVDKYNKVKKTTTYFTELTLEFTWINAENPEETIVIPFYSQGVDIAGEKGVGKGLTYGEKTFLLKQFNIATDQDDPDAFQERAETYSKDIATNEQIMVFQNKAQEYCTLKGQGTPEEIYKSFKIDFDKVTSKEITTHIRKLDGAIAKAIKEAVNETN